MPTEPNVPPSELRNLVNMCKPGPNYINNAVKVDTKFNIEAWKHYEYAYAHHDPTLLKQITYGFPVPYQKSDPPSVPYRNHNSAYANPELIDAYILKNLDNGSLMGPYSVNPLDQHVTVSPLQVSFSSSGKPRVVVDCSWRSPSVNDGISEDWTKFPGYDGEFHLPSVDDLVQKILTTEPPVKLWKADLDSYYKQILVDPGDIHYLGFIWRGSLWLDRTAPFGLRSAALCAQRITVAVCRIYYAVAGIDLVGYIDDYACAVTLRFSQYSYLTYIDLTDVLGLGRSLHKCMSPDDIMLFLGLEHDAVLFVIRIPQDKIDRAITLLQSWLSKDRASKSQLQSLLGILNHIGAVVLAGRVFTAAILDSLRAIGENGTVTIDDDFRSDVNMWLTFLQDPNFTGRAFMKSPLLSIIDEFMCVAVKAQVIMVQMDGVSRYYKVASIHEFKDSELYVVAVWYLSKTVTFDPKKCVIVSVPTLVVQNMINRAATKSSILRRLIREAALAQANKDCYIKAVKSEKHGEFVATMDCDVDYGVIVV